MGPVRWLILVFSAAVLLGLLVSGCASTEVTHDVDMPIQAHRFVVRADTASTCVAPSATR